MTIFIIYFFFIMNITVLKTTKVGPKNEFDK